MSDPIGAMVAASKSAVNGISRGSIAIHNGISANLVGLRVAIRRMSEDGWLEIGEQMAEERLRQLEELVVDLEDAIKRNGDVLDHHLRPAFDVAVDHVQALERRPEAAVEHKQSDPEVRRQVLALTDGACAYCGTAVQDGDGFCIEHVVPVASGGPHNLANYVPACKSCNSSKGDRHVLLFIRRNLPGRIERTQLKIVGEVAS
jgi:hypothetical protein